LPYLRVPNTRNAEWESGKAAKCNNVLDVGFLKLLMV